MQGIDKIVCLGKNYIEHATELGDEVPEKPVLFLKPASVLKTVKSWEEHLQVKYPQGRGEVHYECEIVLQLGQGGVALNQEQAQKAIQSVTLGLDMTLRTEQARLKKKGHPWTTAKVFKDSAIMGPLIPIDAFPTYLEEEFTFSLEGMVKQKAKGMEMRMKPIEAIMYISRFFPLCAGDLIFTGTPVGVGSVAAGQKAVLSWGKQSYGVSWV